MQADDLIFFFRWDVERVERLGLSEIDLWHRRGIDFLKRTKGR